MSIKIENVVLASPEQMAFIIEGMRNPMNSWDRSDSRIRAGLTDTFELGENDLSLMQRLSNAGTDHRKFMRMMPVYARITAPLYWWKEFETYKVGTVSNSCSTVHRITEKEFTLDDFSHDHLDAFVLENAEHRTIEDGEFISLNSEGHLRMIIHHLNYNREKYIETKDKKYWNNIIQLLPSSYNQTRNIMMNYEVLANIYRSRKNHKLDEWCIHKDSEDHDNQNKDFTSGKWGFCDWIESLPNSELITRTTHNE